MFVKVCTGLLKFRNLDESPGLPVPQCLNLRIRREHRDVVSSVRSQRPWKGQATHAVAIPASDRITERSHTPPMSLLRVNARLLYGRPSSGGECEWSFCALFTRAGILAARPS